MILTIYTWIHVAISLVGIFSGLVVMFGLLGGKRLAGWTSLFLVTTVATSATGFFFPFHGFKPSYVVGALSLVLLAIAIYARYSRHLAGASRITYVITAMISLWFNCFVGIVQAYKNVPALHALAPTQTEQPFKLTQLTVLSLFVVLTIVAAIKFHPKPAAQA